MRGLFVTGTGTNVGKTVVAAGILRALRRSGVDAVPMKPFQTGCERQVDGRLAAPDLSMSLRVAQYTPPEDLLADLCPYAYEPACSPHLAARLAGDVPRIEVVERAAARLLERHAMVVAEGAGGVLVPINERHTMRDVMRRLGWPVLVVAPAGLGGINATLLTLSALRAARLTVFGVVLCDVTPCSWDYIHEDNPDAIARFGRVRILARLPWLGDDPGAEPSVWDRFETCFDPPIARWLASTPAAG